MHSENVGKPKLHDSLLMTQFLQEKAMTKDVYYE